MSSDMSPLRNLEKELEARRKRALQEVWNDYLDEREAERDERDERRHEASLRSISGTGRI